jgi:hypothetical protein
MNEFTYNEELATQIGGGSYVTKSGGYDFKVTRAEFATGQNGNSKALELDLETRDGLKCNYLSINYVKNDGNANEFGQKMINAIMGCALVQNLTNQNGNCPELFGKYFKGIVQRIDYTKQSGPNAGQDGYKFEFKLPANIQSGKTVKEAKDESEAKSFASYADSIEDKDERTVNQGGFQNQTPNQGNSHNFDNSKPPQQPNGASVEFDDDIPF